MPPPPPNPQEEYVKRCEAFHREAGLRHQRASGGAVLAVWRPTGALRGWGGGSCSLKEVWPQNARQSPTPKMAECLPNLFGNVGRELHFAIGRMKNVNENVNGNVQWENVKKAIL